MGRGRESIASVIRKLKLLCVSQPDVTKYNTKTLGTALNIANCRTLYTIISVSFGAGLLHLVKGEKKCYQWGSLSEIHGFSVIWNPQRGVLSQQTRKLMTKCKNIDKLLVPAKLSEKLDIPLSRVYDILNVLRGFHLVTRGEKGYKWKGYDWKSEYTWVENFEVNFTHQLSTSSESLDIFTQL